MLITEAAQLLQSKPLNDQRPVALLCSFEPLHLKTYLQAYVALYRPQQTPRVLTFGFDQLEAGLSQTSGKWKTAPAVLFLAWEDLHPALSWRARGSWEGLLPEDLQGDSEKLKKRLLRWLEARAGAETYVVAPPMGWLPLIDCQAPPAVGPLRAQAAFELWGIVQALSKKGARALPAPSSDVNFRDLIQSGCPLSPELSEQVAKQCAAFLFPPAETKKALVTDLDGTLWFGILGEDGPSSLQCRLEGKGAAFFVFQKFLRKLKEEGTLLGFCSKNNPEDVLPVFDSLNLPLKKSDFAAYRCNWSPKSANLLAMAKELNILPASMVMVEDNDAEIAEIRKNAPEIKVLRTPQDGKGWKQLFDELQAHFGRWRVSDEDRQRTRNLQDNLKRKEFFENHAVPAQKGGLHYLRDLRLEIGIDPAAFKDPRSLELVNKTNQFNLHGERVPPDQWARWARDPKGFCLSARLKDRFGDFGTIAVAVGKRTGKGSAFLENLALSCRAFGRGVEYVLLQELMRRMKLNRLSGRFKYTQKNEPAKQFLAGQGCSLMAQTDWELRRNAVDKRAREIRKEAALAVR